MSIFYTNDRKFLDAIFRSPPDSVVNGIFKGSIQDQYPVFVPYVAQYAIEAGRPIWLYCFIRDFGPRTECVGVFQDDLGADVMPGVTVAVMQLDLEPPNMMCSKRPATENSDAEALRFLAGIRDEFRDRVPEIDRSAGINHLSPDGAIFHRYCEGVEIIERNEVGHVRVEGGILLGTDPHTGEDVLRAMAYQPAA